MTSLIMNRCSSEYLANLALRNASLAVEMLGIGCFYTGFVVLAVD